LEVISDPMKAKQYAQLEAENRLFKKNNNKKINCTVPQFCTTLQEKNKSVHSFN